MKKIFTVLICIIMIASLGGCSKKNGIDSDKNAVDENVQEESTPQQEVPKQEPEKQQEDLTGKVASPYTGLDIKEEVANKRPFAIMINNYKKALPQSGISQADIYYETLAEGGISRILAVFQNFDAEKIGPVRSARHYYLDFAFDNDAIFVHHGGSQLAYNAIKTLKVNNLDGMKLEGTDFYRDKERIKQPGMYEHSSYTGAKLIAQAAEKYKYRLKATDAEGMFDFYKEDTTNANGQVATNVIVPFSGAQKSEFHFEEGTKMYMRSQNGTKQIDVETNQQLAVKNIIIQYTTITPIKNDKEGRLDVKLVGSGRGLFISNGKAVPILWNKTSHQNPTMWLDENGNKLTINKGKTWICVYPSSSDVTIN